MLVVSVAAAYWCLTVVSERTLLYGRRLLYTAILFGAVIPCIAVAVLASFGYYTSSIEVYAIGSILPGVAAYNAHRRGERLVEERVRRFERDSRRVHRRRCSDHTGNAGTDATLLLQHLMSHSSGMSRCRR